MYKEIDCFFFLKKSASRAPAWRWPGKPAGQGGGASLGSEGTQWEAFGRGEGTAPGKARGQ